MNSILITGCNRGLGLGLVKQLLLETSKPTKYIFATCRNPDKALVYFFIIFHIIFYLIFFVQTKQQINFDEFSQSKYIKLTLFKRKFL